MLGLIADVARAVFLAPEIERARRTLGPHDAVAIARSFGRDGRRHSERRRSSLRWVIRMLDRLFRGGPNCYRRALLEMALDRDAATEKLMMGFRMGGEPRSGHAWLASEPTAGTYDGIISV
jgi:hypothetical protein